MSKRIIAPATVAAALVAVGGLVVLQLSADEPLITEGLPLVFDLVEANLTANGATVKYRSRPFELTLESASWLMNDPEHPGDRGQHGDITWFRVPDDYTVTIFPEFVTEATAILPSWAGDVQQFAQQHPDVTLVTQSEHAGELLNGQFVEKASYEVSCPPLEQCGAANRPNPCVIEYRAQFGGNFTGVQAPQTVAHLVYRVRNST